MAKPQVKTNEAANACDLRDWLDDVQSLGELMRALVECRVKPYYLHHCDLAPGTSHWRTPIEDGQALVLSEVSGEAIDIEARVDLGNASKIELVLSFVGELQEAIAVSIDRRVGELSIDHVLGDEVLPGPRTSVRAGAGSVQLRVLFDRSVVEVFSDLTAPLTEMVYPKRIQLSGVKVVSTGGKAHLEAGAEVTITVDQ